MLAYAVGRPGRAAALVLQPAVSVRRDSYGVQLRPSHRGRDAMVHRHDAHDPAAKVLLAAVARIAWESRRDFRRDGHRKRVRRGGT